MPILQKNVICILLEKKLERFLKVTLGAYHVPDDIQRETIAYIGKLKIREITGQVMNKLFMALAMKYDFTFHEANTKKEMRDIMTRKEFHKRLLITSLLLGLVLPFGKCTGNIIIKPDQKSGGSRAAVMTFAEGKGAGEEFKEESWVMD